MDNINNNASSEEQVKGGDKNGYKGNRRFNKNKKRFDKEQSGEHKGSNKTDNNKNEHKSFDKKRADGKNFNHKKGGDFKHKGKNDHYKKFDSKKKNKDYKRSENDIDLVKAEKMGVIYEGELEEKTVAVEVAETVEEQKVVTQTEETVQAKEAQVPETSEEKAEHKPIEKPVEKSVEKSAEKSNYQPKETREVLVNDFNIEKDYVTGKQSDKLKREDVASAKKQIEIIGVRFRKAGKIYYFSRGKFDVEVNQHVIVETARGVEYGRVVLSPRMVDDKPSYHPLKSIIRVATPNDDKVEAENKVKEKEALAICLEKIRKHKLEMKLIDCEYTFDNNKVLFYFTADGRIDFRELVKDLAAVFRTRIELRQIGVRDETKIVGGIGTCGRPLCCHTYLSDFIPVSIKMAKEQNLSLNPTKISGVCGRLMCCLKNEEDWYEEANMKLPYIGDQVDTADGFKGEVHSVNVVKQIVRVIITLDNDEKEAREYHVDDLKFERRKRHDRVAIDDELRKLEMLEKHDIKSNLEDE